MCLLIMIQQLILWFNANGFFLNLSKVGFCSDTKKDMIKIINKIGIRYIKQRNNSTISKTLSEFSFKKDMHRNPHKIEVTIYVTTNKNIVKIIFYFFNY